MTFFSVLSSVFFRSTQPELMKALSPCNKQVYAIMQNYYRKITEVSLFIKKKSLTSSQNVKQKTAENCNKITEQSKNKSLANKTVNKCWLHILVAETL
jgi:hypothetical protein